MRMTVRLGDIAPDFEQDTFNGSMRFHQWIGSSWCILFRTMNFATANGFRPDCSRRGVKLVGLSMGLSEVEDCEFPVIIDKDRTVHELYGTVSPGAVYLIDPDKRIRLMRLDAGGSCDLHEPLRWLDEQRRGDGPAIRNVHWISGSS
jgi:alkyl hydroperoxide reductase subunit AhpC